MELLSRQLSNGGTSVVDVYKQDGALVLTETDTGPDVETVFGDDDIEYFVSVDGEDLQRLLRLLITDAASERGGATHVPSLRPSGRPWSPASGATCR